ncbi:DUF397 domain-containing protein [Streptomyces xinghaiensis]|uniref:DUF397 domain-containing protein n=1 Tax=Streptomyces xinghaiensis TaxID=1038928 RepID=UPI000BAEA594|nr:DUF397 domain-containing protein [Streptomyces xinghaiensis]MZE75890.1 DUF397 domain-containing protein [Streptomyces sp. SID5475]
MAVHVPTRWQKSTYSGGGDGNHCLELAEGREAIKVRESDDPGVVVMTTPGSLRSLMRGIKEGEFDRFG